MDEYSSVRLLVRFSVTSCRIKVLKAAFSLLFTLNFRWKEKQVRQKPGARVRTNGKRTNKCKKLSENMRDRRREGWEEESQKIERQYKEAETAGRTSRHDGLQKKRLVFV